MLPHLIAAMYLLPAMTNGIQDIRGIETKITLIAALSIWVCGTGSTASGILMGMGIEAFPLAYMAGWIEC